MNTATQINLQVNLAASKQCLVKLPVHGYPGRAVEVHKVNERNFLTVEVCKIGTLPAEIYSGRAGHESFEDALNFALSLQGFNTIALPRYVDGHDPEGEDIEAELQARIELAYPL